MVENELDAMKTKGVFELVAQDEMLKNKKALEIMWKFKWNCIKMAMWCGSERDVVPEVTKKSQNWTFKSVDVVSCS